MVSRAFFVMAACTREGRDALTMTGSARNGRDISHPKLGDQSNSDWAKRGHARESLLRRCRFL